MIETEMLIGIAFLFACNLLALAFAYGKLTQKVKEICNNLSRIQPAIKEMRTEITDEIKNIHARINDIDRRLSRLEGKSSI